MAIIWKVDGHQVIGYGTLANKLTTADTYADVDTIKVDRINCKTFRFSAATNNLVVNVLGSLDGGATFPITLEADIAVATTTPVNKTYLVSTSTPFITDIKIQVKPAASGQNGTLSTAFAGALL